VKKTILNLLVLAALAFAGPLLSSGSDGEFDHIKVEFELLDHEGKPFTQSDLHGKYVLLAFGFTHCQHICPMMGAKMGMTLKIADQEAAGVFISVDTERDTPAITNTYASRFNESMMGLSGSHEQVRKAANHFGVSFVVTKSQKAYTVEHTSDIFLIDPEGKVIDVFTLDAPPGVIAASLNHAASE